MQALCIDFLYIKEKNMKNKILKEITNNTCKLIKYKTIKNEYKEFDKAYDFIKQELNNYNIKEYIINNYKNLVISNTEENNLDIIFCAHLDVVPAESYDPRCLR
jgi:acetylornithine deacetylase/succinyl-diaminopimelate desuccinylase-like protein